MTMTLSGDGTITGLVAGGLPNATVTADDLAAGAALNSVSDGVFFRNRIINGDMRIDQRNAGASASFAASASGYTLDRFLVENVTDGALTVQQSSTAPTGFSKSTLITITTADASLSATQRCRILQAIEGFNTADLSFGSASAKTVTLSFWVRSSLTGTFGGALNNGGVDRSYPFTYAISAADTWEYKTVTIEGETSGTWNTGNTVGMYVQFGLGVGSTFSGTSGSWASSQIMSTTGATSVIGTLNATWYITGVQLEVGSVATPFERRPYGTELSLCQRYCFVLNETGDWGWGTATSSSAGYIGVNLPVPPRVPPTGITATIGSAPDTLYVYNGGFSSSAVTGVTFSFAGVGTSRIVRLAFSGASGLTAGQATPIACNGSTPKIIFNGMEL